VSGQASRYVSQVPAEICLQQPQPSQADQAILIQDKGCGVAIDLSKALVEGAADVPKAGAVIPNQGLVPPFLVIEHDVQVEPVTAYLCDLALNDMSPLTGASRGHDPVGHSRATTPSLRRS
jgi:hypothetical protein